MTLRAMKSHSDNAWREAALASKAWPFEEARKITDRLARQGRTTGEVLFETGYGPSACPISAPSARWRGPPWFAMPSRP